MQKIAMLFPYAPAYRKRIYELMDRSLDIDWYFCGDAKRPLKLLDYKILKKCDLTLSEKNIGPILYYKGIDTLDFSKYDYLIIAGVIRSISECKIMLKSGRNGFPKLFLWTHGWYGKESLIQRIVKKFFFKRVEGLFLYGQYARNLLVKEDIEAEKLFVIRNSLDYDTQLELRNRIAASKIYTEYFRNDNPVLVMIGRLNFRKKLSMLIQAVSILKQKSELFNIVLIGDGEDRSVLEEMCRQQGILDQVWFYGACYDEYTNGELLYNSDMCVVPGDIGLTVMHCMMFGVPVITHDHYPTQGPEFEAIVEGKTGAFFKADDVISLSNVISAWFKNKKSREDVRQACYQEIDTYWNPQYQLKVIKQALRID